MGGMSPLSPQAHWDGLADAGLGCGEPRAAAGGAEASPPRCPATAGEQGELSGRCSGPYSEPPSGRGARPGRQPRQALHHPSSPTTVRDRSAPTSPPHFSLSHRQTLRPRARPLPKSPLGGSGPFPLTSREARRGRRQVGRMDERRGTSRGAERGSG